MTRRQKRLAGILVVGGLAVLASYVVAFISHPETRWDIWGGVPGSLRSLYTVSMLLAAVGFFPMTIYVLYRVDADNSSIVGVPGYHWVVSAYVLVLSGSAAWMPLTYAMIDAPSSALWIAIRVVLFGVALGGIALLAILLRLYGRPPGWQHRLAVLGCVLFCWQTVILDALVWPYYFAF